MRDAERTGGDDRAPGERGAAKSAWLLRGAARLVLARYPERGPEIVAIAQCGRDRPRRGARRGGEPRRLALRPASTRAVWLQGALLAVALAGLVALTPLALVLPFALLALGVFDARLAAGATLFWLFRLVTADLAEGHLAALAADARRVRARRARDAALVAPRGRALTGVWPQNLRRTQVCGHTPHTRFQRCTTA